MKKKIIFRYRLTSDTGCAPCVDNDLFTLACCKGGQIRNGKPIECGLRHFIGSLWNDNNIRIDDYEIYISGIYKNKFLFLAKITDVIEMTKYYSHSETNKRYRQRKDDIYCIKNGTLERNSFNYNFHGCDEARHKKDIAGKYVLISDEFVYYGKEAVRCAEEILSHFPKTRGERPTGRNKYRPSDILTESNIKEGEKLFELIKKFYGGEEHLKEGTKGREPHEKLEVKMYCKGCS